MNKIKMEMMILLLIHIKYKEKVNYFVFHSRIPLLYLKIIFIFKLLVDYDKLIKKFGC